MMRYFVSRMSYSLVLLWCVTVVTFLLMHQAPGGPAVLADPNISKGQLQSAQESLGLNDPLPIQYAEWLGRVLQGDLGSSFDRGASVTSIIGERLPNTLLLAATALLFAVAVGVVAGTIAAVKRGSWIDTAISATAVAAVSTPPFWLAIMFVLIFAVRLDWLPASGMAPSGAEGLSIPHLILPAFVTASFVLAVVMRYARATLIDVLQQTYVTNARARGLPGWRVMVHALRNAAVPLITVVSLAIPALVGGTAIVETVFAWPGIGQLAVQSAINSDYPLILGITLVMSVLVVVVNLLADLSYTLADPRIRLGAAE